MSDHKSKLQTTNIVNRLILIIILILLIVAAQFLPIKDNLMQILSWITGLGTKGSIIIIFIYIISSIAVLPTWYLSIGAGFILGIPFGTMTVSLGSTIGACLAFIIGRTIARAWITKWTRKNVKYQQFDEAINNEGFKLIFLMRLGPLFPYNILNYAASLTKISFWHYCLASWLGMLPASLMYVYFGSAARSLTELTKSSHTMSTTQQVVFWFGLIMTIVITFAITRIATKSLRKVQEVKLEHKL